MNMMVKGPAIIRALCIVNFIRCQPGALYNI
jgi:hypothetical protein